MFYILFTIVLKINSIFHSLQFLKLLFLWNILCIKIQNLKNISKFMGAFQPVQYIEHNLEVPFV